MDYSLEECYEHNLYKSSDFVLKKSFGIVFKQQKTIDKLEELLQNTPTNQDILKELAKAKLTLIKFLEKHAKILKMFVNAEKIIRTNTPLQKIEEKNITTNKETNTTDIKPPKLITVDASCLFKPHVLEKNELRKLKQDDAKRINGLIRVENEVATLKKKISCLKTYSEIIDFAKQYLTPNPDERRSRCKFIYDSINKFIPEQYPSKHIFKVLAE
jgi:hypothetical protein